MEETQIKDMQGLIVRGYGAFPVAGYLLLQFGDPAGARRWLAHTSECVAPGAPRPETSALHLAFTKEGLEALGLPPATLATFSEDFQAGMTSPHKRRLLGDEGASAPESWIWGGPNNDPVHAALLLYALDEVTLNAEVQHHSDRLSAAKIRIVQQLSAEDLPGGKEHFGFRDGIGQPRIAEFGVGAPDEHAVALGEFVLGYPNAYGRLTQRPLVASEHDPSNWLSRDLAGSGAHDLGLNGSYLVFRQMRQDVRGFWSFLREKSEGPQEAIRLASKMVGRWPGGASLVQSPDAEFSGTGDLDAFGYHDLDPHGLRCPFGAHVRRANPRDSLEPEPGTSKSVAAANRHRILRRGRAYGRPLTDSMEPKEILARSERDDSDERGIHFICLNANLARQFEFVQQTWVNNPHFAGLYEETDPLIGSRQSARAGRQDVFSIPGEPVRRRVLGLPDFVQVQGGAYFFLPSLRALRFLASL